VWHPQIWNLGRDGIYLGAENIGELHQFDFDIEFLTANLFARINEPRQIAH
jgi:hypothetical protein